MRLAISGLLTTSQESQDLRGARRIRSQFVVQSVGYRGSGSPGVSGRAGSRKETTASIGARLAEAPKWYAGEIGDLASLFEAIIDRWESRKPNKPNKIEEWEAHYNDLRQIRDALNDLTAKIEKLEKQSTTENQQDAGEQAFTLLEKLNKFFEVYTDTIVDKAEDIASFSVVVIATLALTQIAGVYPALALGPSMAAFGKKSWLERIKLFFSRGKSTKSNDKPPDDEEVS